MTVGACTLQRWPVSMSKNWMDSSWTIARSESSLENSNFASEVPVSDSSMREGVFSLDGSDVTLTTPKLPSYVPNANFVPSHEDAIWVTPLLLAKTRTKAPKLSQSSILASFSGTTASHLPSLQREILEVFIIASTFPFAFSINSRLLELISRTLMHSRGVLQATTLSSGENAVDPIPELRSLSLQITVREILSQIQNESSITRAIASSLLLLENDFTSM